MPRVAHSGHGRVSIIRPRALAVCDRCGETWNKVTLTRQFQWGGTALYDTGLLVCPDCLDVPQDQLRSVILPPDPVPVENPRPDYNVTPVPTIIGQPLPTTPANQGFTQYTTASIYPQYPTTKAAALSAIASLSGIPTPPQIFDRSIASTQANAPQTVVIAQPARGWILLYNPAVTPMQVAFSSTASFGAISNVALGAGEAYFWATTQGLGACYQGAVTVIGGTPGVQFWAWESGGNVLWLTDDYGNLITDDQGHAIPLV
jgi:hypothetical protein